MKNNLYGRYKIAQMLSVALLFNCPEVYADSVHDMVPKLSADKVSSPKSSASLEYCISVGIGDWLLPATFHGENRVMIYGSPTVTFSNAIYMLVAIDDRGDHREITFHAHKAWDDKTAALIKSCA